MNIIRLVVKFATLCFALMALESTAFANTAIIGAVDNAELQQVQTLLEVPESQINFAHAKLTIDQMVDPTISINHEIQRLDEIVHTINSMGLTTSMEKKDALRRYLYEASSWNQFSPLTYDFNDPKGTNIKSKLLGNYLTSKKGNCISMPFLFIVLGQKLGLDVTASTAPLHVFVKYTDDETGITYNLETTSGANPARDSWLRQGFPVTDTAIRNGIYLQKLTRKETVAVMANMLLQHYYEQKQFGQLIATADVILSHYPKAVSAIIYKASAHNQLLKTHGLWRYRTPDEVPQQKQDTFKYLVSRVNAYHNQAVSMGWRPPSQVENEAYLKKIEQEVIN